MRNSIAILHSHSDASKKSVEELLRQIVFSNSSSEKEAKYFLYSYHCFVNAWILFSKLIGQFEEIVDKEVLSKKEAIKHTTAFIRTWCNIGLAIDFTRKRLWKMVLQWLAENAPYATHDIGTLIKKRCSNAALVCSTKTQYKFQTKETKSTAIACSDTNTSDKKNKKKKEESNPARLISTMNYKFLATCLTQLEWEVFSHIEPHEFLLKYWHKSSSKKNIVCPNVDILKNRFNQVSYWAATEVVKGRTAKERGKAIKRLILLSHLLLFQLGNFNSSLSIFTGLQLSSVVRLKDSWKLISYNTYQKYKEIEKVASSTSSYKAYRQMKQSRLDSLQPVIPWLVVHISDIFKAQDANDDIVENDDEDSNAIDGAANGFPTTTEKITVNFDKMTIIGKVVEDVLRCKRIAPSCVSAKSNMNILQALFNVSHFTEEELYAKSLQIRPRLQHSIPSTPRTSTTATINRELSTSVPNFKLQMPRLRATNSNNNSNCNATKSESFDSITNDSKKKHKFNNSRTYESLRRTNMRMNTVPILFQNSILDDDSDEDNDNYDNSTNKVHTSSNNNDNDDKKSVKFAVA